MVQHQPGRCPSEPPARFPGAAYPWSAPARAGVLGPDGLGTTAPTAEALAGRTPVVAVGSNASPAVLRRKLGALLEEGLPLAPAAVTGLDVGHSAHVSVGGYVAAAPVRADGRTVRAVVVGWMTPRQLATLDATEPSYRRVPVPPDLPCRPDPSLRLPLSATAGAQVYDSRHGVLAEAGRPLPVGDQASVLAWLARRLPLAAAYGLTRWPPERAHAALADPDVREQIRQDIADLGLRTGSGLVSRR